MALHDLSRVRRLPNRRAKRPPADEECGAPKRNIDSVTVSVMWCVSESPCQLSCASGVPSAVSLRLSVPCRESARVYDTRSGIDLHGWHQCHGGTTARRRRVTSLRRCSFGLRLSGHTARLSLNGAVPSSPAGAAGRFIHEKNARSCTIRRARRIKRTMRGGGG